MNTNARSRIGGEVCDTRDLIEIADEIEDLIDEHGAGLDLEALLDMESVTLEEHGLDLDDLELLRDIRAIADAGIDDYRYGETLIREDYFEDYARELAEDIGAIPSDAAWPLTYIDWPSAADALRVDYIEVELLGHTYLVRA